MTTLQSRCPRCHQVATLTPDDIELLLDPPPGETGSYTFLCPSCDTYVRRPADTRIVELLLASGVRRPNRPHAEAPNHKQLPPLTHDDLLDFHLLLTASDDWFDRVLEMVSSIRPEVSSHLDL